jgi:hypothetical protein
MAFLLFAPLGFDHYTFRLEERNGYHMHGDPWEEERYGL